MVSGRRIVKKKETKGGLRKQGRFSLGKDGIRSEEMVLGRGWENTVFAELAIKEGQMETGAEEIQFPRFGGGAVGAAA